MEYEDDDINGNRLDRQRDLTQLAITLAMEKTCHRSSIGSAAVLQSCQNPSRLLGDGLGAPGQPQQGARNRAKVPVRLSQQLRGTVGETASRAHR
jgi:hypothetical protein